MQIVSHSASSSSSSSSSTSSSSHSSGEQKGMEKFKSMQLHSPPPPPPPPHFKLSKKHRHHSPPPPHHHQHRHHHFVNQHDRQLHHSLACSLASCEKGKLRVKPPKPSKKVRKLHHKLMKACKLPYKGGAHHHYHVPPPAGAAYEHPLGCCLHNRHGMSMADERPGPHHEADVGHHGHRRRSARPHPHKRHPCVKSEIRRGGALPPMFPSYAPAEPAPSVAVAAAAADDLQPPSTAVAAAAD